MKNINLGLYSTFRSPEVFRKVFKNNGLKRGFDYDYKRNERTKLGVYCLGGNCRFWCWCSGVGDKEMVQICVWRDEHSRGRPTEFKKMTSTFIAERFLEKIRVCPDMKLKMLKALILKKFMVQVHKRKLYRALGKAREMLAGATGKQYETLLTYCDMIRKSNSGSTAKIDFKCGGRRIYH